MSGLENAAEHGAGFGSDWVRGLGDWKAAALLLDTFNPVGSKAECGMR